MSTHAPLRHRFTSRGALWAFAVTAFFVPSFMAGCADGPPAMATPDDCLELRTIEAHLVVSLGTPEHPSDRVRAELDRHENGLAALGGEADLAECTRTRTAASVACARRATSLAELGTCSTR